MIFSRPIFYLVMIPLLASCSSSKDQPLDATDVCKLISSLDVSKVSNSEMADQAFDAFALKLQDMTVRSEVKEVFNLLIGADAKDTYQLYLEAGDAYKEDWSCAPMQNLLSIQ